MEIFLLSRKQTRDETLILGTKCVPSSEGGKIIARDYNYLSGILVIFIKIIRAFIQQTKVNSI